LLEQLLAEGKLKEETEEGKTVYKYTPGNSQSYYGRAGTETSEQRRKREAGMHGGGAPPLDIFLKVPGAHHAFNLLVSARTLACGDAIADVLNEWRRRELARRRAKSQ
jgi:hypothetical protein